MATTSNQVLQMQGAGRRLSAPVAASTKIPEKTIVFFERTSGATEGYATNVCDSGTNDFAGISVKEADNSSGSAGDISVEYYTIGAFLLTGTGFVQGYVGDLAYASDNFTVTASASSTTKLGAFSEYVSATQMWVAIDAIQA